ncbi:MAG: universal stress protein [Solirubrobacterales bacterium]
MFKHLLVCLDGSAHSDEALSRAIELATATPGATLELLSVWEEPFNWVTGGPLGPPSDLEAIHTLLRRDHEEIVKAAEARVPEGVAVVSSVRGGDPARSIIERADSGEIDLIVMGSRGRGWVGSALMGSVSLQVLHECDVPVLIVHAPASPGN